MTLRLFLSKLGVDDWALIICGLVALFIAVLDFLQILQMSNEASIRIILIAIGLILTAIVVQSVRRTSESEALLTSLDAALIEPIDSTEFHFYMQQKIAKAKRFVADTTLHSTIVAQREFLHPKDLPKTHYALTLYKRIQKEEITCWAVETIASKERLEWVIFRLFVYEGMGWFIRYYDSTPKAIPVLNIVSIDNDIFILGSFYGSTAPGEKVTDISIKNQKISHFLTDYWNNLWLHAKPLNEGGRINWEELRTIANRVGMEQDEFKAMVDKWKSKFKSERELLKSTLQE